MRLSRTLRRFVAGTVAVLFMACQGAMIAYARSVDATGSSAGAVQGPCHDPGPQTGDTTTKSTCQANCQSQVTSSSPSSANVFAAVDLPAVTARIDHTVVVSDSAPPADPLLWVEPPRLVILHCRFRN